MMDRLVAHPSLDHELRHPNHFLPLAYFVGNAERGTSREPPLLISISPSLVSPICGP